MQGAISAGQAVNRQIFYQHSNRLERNLWRAAFRVTVREDAAVEGFSRR